MSLHIEKSDPGVTIFEFLTCTHEEAFLRLIFSTFQYSLNLYSKRQSRFIDSIEVDFDITLIECLLQVINNMTPTEYLERMWEEIRNKKRNCFIISGYYNTTYFFLALIAYCSKNR